MCFVYWSSIQPRGRFTIYVFDLIRFKEFRQFPEKVPSECVRKLACLSVKLTIDHQQNVYYPYVPRTSITLIRATSSVSAQKPAKKSALHLATFSCAEFIIRLLYLPNTYSGTHGRSEMPSFLERASCESGRLHDKQGFGQWKLLNIFGQMAYSYSGGVLLHTDGSHPLGIVSSI